MYVGWPLAAPIEWKQAKVTAHAVSLSGEDIALKDVTSFLVTYANGQVLDEERPFLPLPAGVHYVEQNPIARHDILDLSRLTEGNGLVAITYGTSVSRPKQEGHYSTMIRNVSDRRIRVLRFGGYAKSGDAFVLNTISGDFFSAAEFVNWYGCAKDGWIQPGQAVTDPDNYGCGDGYWVYFFETDDDREFMAGAQIPE